MATLPEQLERLEASVERAGGVVHWARDGAEANAIVGRIALSHGAREVVKVKSIATDEIGLNDALAAQGISAIETDLAELILQLSNDKTSHILVPAIHRNRMEIKALFERTITDEKLGTEASAHRRGRAAAPARQVPLGAGRRVGRELRRRRDGHGGGGRVRGQRPHVHDAAEGARDRDGDREGPARVARPRGLPPAAAAVVDRRADEPVHVAVDRRARPATGRRSSTSCCSTAGGPTCWPTSWAARRCTASAARRA